MRIWALVVVLMLSLLPTMEVVEAAVHLAEHGDLAHDSHDEGGQAIGTDEHGCSGTFHLCACHTANVIPPTLAESAIATPAPDFAVASFAVHDGIGRGATAPPIRPPIA